MVQKRVNEMLKGKNSSSSSNSSSGSSSSSSSGKVRTISEATDDYNKTKTKTTSTKDSVTEKGKKQTEYYKKQKKSLKHNDMDYGSILISDLMGGN